MDLPAQSPLKAAALMIVSSALIALSTLAAKAAQVRGDLHPLQVTQARFLFAFLALLLVLAVLRPTFENPAWRVHVARATCGWAGATLMFAAAALIPLSDATALSFLNPVFALVLTVALLGERPGPWRWAATFIALCGAMVLIRPGASLEFGAVLAVAAAAIMGLEITIIKFLTGREGPMQILAINNLLGLGIASIAASAVWTWPPSAAWPWLICVGVAMLGAQASFIQALRRADASFVSPLAFTVLIFATFYDYALFSVLPDAVSWLGITIILAGAGLLAWREARRA